MCVCVCVCVCARARVCVWVGGGGGGARIPVAREGGSVCEEPAEDIPVAVVAATGVNWASHN